MATWRSGYAAACKAVYTGSIPVVASEKPCKWLSLVFVCFLLRVWAPLKGCGRESE